MWKYATSLIILLFAEEETGDFLQTVDSLPGFFCLVAGSFLTELPWLRRRTGLVSHFLRVFPERLGPGELDCSELRDGCG